MTEISEGRMRWSVVPGFHLDAPFGHVLASILIPEPFLAMPGMVTGKMPVISAFPLIALAAAVWRIPLLLYAQIYTGAFGKS